MDTQTINLLVAVLALTTILVALILLTSTILARRIARAVPALTSPMSLPEINSYMEYYRGQLADFLSRIESADKKNRELAERADAVENRSRLIEQKLITAYDHMDWVYNKIESQTNGAPLVSLLREHDPRYRQVPPEGT
jgi:hypothetical protein